MNRKRVLILCTGNSCRSQMAEAIWRELGHGEWECHSAGSAPTGFVHPLALAALREDGIRHPDAWSKSISDFSGQSFDRVITVCSAAAERCPTFPGVAVEHWPFPDPADAPGDALEQFVVFEQVRESIRRRVAEALARETFASFAEWLERSLETHPGLRVSSDERYRRLIGDVEAHWDDPWPQLPRLVRERFADRGWAWNGFYRRPARSESVLSLSHAAGPPVCATLERRGDVGTSGMCWDAVLQRQTVATNDVSIWPGYVSCDSDSGIVTKAGMVIPIRNRSGRIVAVWDLDSTSDLLPSDPVFFETFFGTLVRYRAPLSI
ncbi:MAG: hypothetical protein KDC38_21230 [Planctomycetes bacterium]|nr:hypothetical protein [Planctomycetota bacterium]